MSQRSLETTVPEELRAFDPNADQSSIPTLAKDAQSIAKIRQSISELRTSHEVIFGGREKHHNST